MKIAVVFPGYISQFVGMGKDLYDENRIVQEYFEEASNCLNINFVKLCFASSDQELSKMQHAYPAIFLMSSAIYALLKEQGIEPLIHAGYNQGEFSAFHAAGSISFPDGLYLLTKYALLYRELLDNTHVAAVYVTGISYENMQDVCIKATDENAQAIIGIHESLTSYVITGNNIAMDRVKELAFHYEGTQIQDVPVEIGLHSQLMLPVTEQFKHYLEKVDFKSIEKPVLSGSTGQVLSDGGAIKEQIMMHPQDPINWYQVLQVLSLYDLIIQVGPGVSVAQIIKQHYPEKHVVAINKKSDFDELQSIITLMKQQEQS